MHKIGNEIVFFVKTFIELEQKFLPTSYLLNYTTALSKGSNRSRLMVSNRLSADACVMEDDGLYFTPKHAADEVQRLIGLEDEQRNILEDHLNEDDEDAYALLVLRLNPEWIAGWGRKAAADHITDEIAQYLVGEHERRDKAGKRWLFQFEPSCDMDDIEDCKYFIMSFCPEAFSLTPVLVAEAVALGTKGIPSIPLAFSAVVHKAGVSQVYVDRYGFFYI
ncbi:hypothetical protein R1sor_016019 [Riccia sorocarpa]|uniref:Uncharacterized protein n=1 Tax=Riccia sorocarpa TaxID=122646 RepID=A0ABD3HH99_9MARC